MNTISDLESLLLELRYKNTHIEALCKKVNEFDPKNKTHSLGRSRENYQKGSRKDLEEDLQEQENRFKEGIRRLHDYFLSIRMPPGEPVGGNYAHGLMRTETQKTLNSFYVGSDSADIETQNVLTKIMDLSFQKHELFVRLKFPEKSEYELRAFAGILFRPKLKEFIVSTKILVDLKEADWEVPTTTSKTQKTQTQPQLSTPIQRLCVLELLLSAKKMYRFRLTPFALMSAIYKMSSVRNVIFKGSDTEIKIIVTVVAPLPDILMSWRFPEVAEKYADASAIYAIENVQLCLFNNSVACSVDPVLKTICVYGDVFDEIVATDIIDDEIKNNMVTNDVLKYQNYFGLFAAKQMLVSLYLEILDENLQDTAVFLVNCMFHSGTFCKNNASNIFNESGSILDSMSDRQAGSRTKSLVYRGALTNIGTNSDRIITGSAPRIGAKMMFNASISSIENSRIHKKLLTECWIEFDTNKHVDVMISKLCVNIPLKDLLLNPRRVVRNIHPETTIFVSTLIKIQISNFGGLLSLDLRTPSGAAVEDVFIDNWHIDPRKNKHNIVMQLVNVWRREIEVDLSKSTLCISHAAASWNVCQ